MRNNSSVPSASNQTLHSVGECILDLFEAKTYSQCDATYIGTGVLALVALAAIIGSVYYYYKRTATSGVKQPLIPDGDRSASDTEGGSPAVNSQKIL